MSSKITVKLIIEGDPAHVEATIQQARQFFEVQEEGKTQPIPLRPGIIRRVLRILPPPPPRETA